MPVNNSLITSSYAAGTGDWLGSGDKYNQTKLTNTNGTTETPVYQQQNVQQPSQQSVQQPSQPVQNQAAVATSAANNDFNQMQKALSGNSTLDGQSVVDINREKQIYDSMTNGVRYEPDFIKTEQGANATALKNQEINFAQSLVQDEMLRQGIALGEVQKDVENTRLAEQYYFGNNAGVVSNQGLVDGIKLEGSKFLNAIRADNRTSLNDLRIKADQLKLTANREYVGQLDTYIAQQQTKNLNNLNAIISTGGIANFSDKDVVLMAQESGVSEFQILALKKEAQIMAARGADFDTYSASQKIMEMHPANSQPFDYSIPTSSGNLDSNGTWRFGEPNNGRGQCGEYVNDMLGLKTIGKGLGDTYESKISKTTSTSPIKGGFFVSGAGTKYGHTGLVEDINYTQDGSIESMEIAESNFDNKESFRRITLTATNKPNVFKRPDGSTTTINGYGGGIPKPPSTQAADPVVRKLNDEVIRKTVVPLPVNKNVNVGSLFSNFGLSTNDVGVMMENYYNHGGVANTLLINYMNQNNLPIPPALISNQQPVSDAVKDIETLLKLNGKNTDPEFLNNFALAMGIDSNVALGASALLESQVVSQQNETIQKANNEINLANIKAENAQVIKQKYEEPKKLTELEQYQKAQSEYSASYEAMKKSILGDKYTINDLSSDELRQMRDAMIKVPEFKQQKDNLEAAKTAYQKANYKELFNKTDLTTAAVNTWKERGDISEEQAKELLASISEKNTKTQAGSGSNNGIDVPAANIQQSWLTQ